MKVISRVAILAVVGIALVASALPASANCSSARLIAGCGAGGCKYVYLGTLGTNVTSNLSGNYWGMGGGNVLVGPGDDNGAQKAMGNVDQINFPDWIKGTPAYLAGSWGNPGSDGCVDNATTPSPKRTLVALSDVAAGTGYFAVLCKEADGLANYDFSLAAGQHLLVPIPYPSVVTSSRNGVQAQVALNGLSAAGLAAGTSAIDPSCSGLVRGYKLYTQIRPNAAGPPTDLRPSAGWVLDAGGERTPNTTATVTQPCGAATSFYVANSLVFDSGFETAFVSKPVQVQCDPTRADRPGNFKLIQKPKDVNRRRQ